MNDAEKLGAIRVLVAPQSRINYGYKYDNPTDAYAGGRNHLIDEIREILDAGPEKEDLPMFTRRAYLVIRSMVDGAPIFLAIEAVATTAMEHPEWDMSEERTWEEWERTDARRE